MCINLIGPYVINRANKSRLICKCVTMIDPATGWFEIHEYDDKKSIAIANIAEQEWFSRYPGQPMFHLTEVKNSLVMIFRTC